MIRYKVGCLVDAAKNKGEVSVIAHQANCFNRMKSGVAKSISEAFPEAVHADNNTIAGDQRKLGRFSMAVCKTEPFISPTLVYNLYGQYDYGRQNKLYTDYNHLKDAMVLMKHHLEAYPLNHIGMPKIGCGLANGEWPIVEDIIEDVFPRHDITIYVLNENEIPQEDR